MKETKLCPHCAKPVTVKTRLLLGLIIGFISGSAGMWQLLMLLK